MPQFYVYVLHTDRPLADHASHYVGATSDLLRRLVQHATGQGAKITQAFALAGIEWHVASVYVMSHRCQFLCERRVKKHKQSSKFCGTCSGDAIRCIAGATTADLESLGIPLTSTGLRALAAKENE